MKKINFFQLLAMLFFAQVLTCGSLNFAHADAVSENQANQADEIENLDQAMLSAQKSAAIIEKLVLKAKGTVRERDLLFRVLEQLIQLDRYTRQRSMMGVSGSDRAADSDSPAIKNIQVKIETYSSRYIQQFGKDARVFKVLMVRAKSREAQGKASAMQDYEAVLLKAPVKSEERVKAAVKLGDLYRSQGQQARSVQTLTAALNEAPTAWKVFITESLLQTHLVGKEYARSLALVNWLLAQKTEVSDSQRDSYVSQKGQVLGKLVLEKKLDSDAYFKAIQGHDPVKTALLIESSFLELVVKNEEKMAMKLVQSAAFKALPALVKLSVTSQFATMLYDQKAMDVIFELVKEMSKYEVAPDASVTGQATLKRLTTLSSQIQTTLGKDPKMAKSIYGSVLEGVFAIVTKISVTGSKQVEQGKYNRAMLLLAQEKPESAFPLFRELGTYMDSEQKFSVSMILALKRKAKMSDAWEFKAQPNAAVGPYVGVLGELAKKNCSDEKFQLQICFDSLKGLVQAGRAVEIVPHLEKVLFNTKHSTEIQGQAFSALFDYYQATNQSDQSAALVSKAEDVGLKLGQNEVNEAKKTVVGQVMQQMSKDFNAGLNEKVVDSVRKFEAEHPKQVFPEMYAYGGLSAQRLGSKNPQADAWSQQYYAKFEHLLSQGRTVEPTFIDLVNVGRAVASDRSFQYAQALSSWVKVKSWKDTSQKKLALNAAWFAGDLNALQAFRARPDFCKATDQALCSEYVKNFSLTWASYLDQSKTLSLGNDPADVLLSLQLTGREAGTSQPGRLSKVIQVQNQWSKMDPVKQLAFLPALVHQTKREVSFWLNEESARFKSVKNLMDFQKALGAFKANEAKLDPMVKSAWSDFEVWVEVAKSLAYSQALEALATATTQDQEVLNQDASVKELFEKLQAQLATKQQDWMKRAADRAGTSSVDLSLFDSWFLNSKVILPTDVKVAWDQMLSAPLQILPKSFYEGIPAIGTDLKNAWLRGLADKNWALMGHALVQMSKVPDLAEAVYPNLEAETFLRFGIRVDAQKTLISKISGLMPVQTQYIARFQINTLAIPVMRAPASVSKPNTGGVQK